MKKSISVILVIFAVMAVNGLAHGNQEGAQEKTFMSINVEKPLRQITLPDINTVAGTTHKIPGGLLLGNVTEISTGTYQIKNSTIIVPDNNHKGGIITFEASSPTEKSLELTLRLIPSNAIYETVDISSSSPDKTAVQIQVPEGRNYLHISMKEKKRILVTKLKFNKNKKPGKSASFDGIQLTTDSKMPNRKTYNFTN